MYIYIYIYLTDLDVVESNYKPPTVKHKHKSPSNKATESINLPSILFDPFFRSISTSNTPIICKIYQKLMSKISKMQNAKCKKKDQRIKNSNSTAVNKYALRKYLKCKNLITNSKIRNLLTG